MIRVGTCSSLCTGSPWLTLTVCTEHEVVISRLSRYSHHHPANYLSTKDTKSLLLHELELELVPA
jgi:hypothetical protein